MKSGIQHEANHDWLDPKVSAALAIAQQVIPQNTGLVVAVELTRYTGDATARHTQVIPGWIVEKSKRMGAPLIGIINNGLSILNASIELQLVAKEIIIVPALALDRYLKFEK